MDIFINPERDQWEALLQRPYVDDSSVRATVAGILRAVKEKGDAAVMQFTAQFDGVTLKELSLSDEVIAAAEAEVSKELQAAIRQAKANIEAFHQKQVGQEDVVETMPGVRCWRKSVGIERVGLYIPGGTAPLFSTVLMLGIPAALAACREVILCTPCNREGVVHPAILFTAKLVGITRIFTIGGAQAIAAMAYGTESLPKVHKIFGPGNQYVTAAKQLVQLEGTAIDMPAGPSEVCVLADETAPPDFVAADLLSQAEHGIDSQVLLVGNSVETVNNCLSALDEQLRILPRGAIAAKALDNSKAIVMEDRAAAIDLVNAYAAEHLIISCADAEALAERITNAGSVFIGNYSPESAGDYASGTNHTLPTNGFARAYSGVSVDSFVKKITFQQLSPDGLRHIAPSVVAMAEAEGLDAHARAIQVRVEAERGM